MISSLYDPYEDYHLPYTLLKSIGNKNLIKLKEILGLNFQIDSCHTSLQTYTKMKVNENVIYKIIKPKYGFFSLYF